ncbi:MAG: SPW repeat protein [Halorientalis sp.]
MAGNTGEHEVNTDYEPNPSARGEWLSAIIALLGLWMIVAPFLFGPVTTRFWNGIIVGVLLAIVGGYNYARRTSDQLGSVPAALLAALIGLWLAMTPFVFGDSPGFTEPTNSLGAWNEIVVGVLVFALGVYSA